MTIDWEKLTFAYMKTKSHIIYNYKEGKWDAGQLCEDEHINLHMASTCLHYGQAAFEGLKAFTCKDGKVRIFRVDENAKRLQRSAQRTYMAVPPIELFTEAVNRVVKDNLDFVPPYGTGGSLYIRPLLIGTQAQIGVKPSNEYKFIIMVMPVGAYYKNGLTAVPALIQDEFDRAAPQGVGDVKLAGNYAAGLYAQAEANKAGFPINLFLDARTHQFVEEFGTSNFIGITKDQHYITPASRSVLPSITNKSLQQLAKDQGLTVEVRDIPYKEIKELQEVGACGTAVVLTPISEIVRNQDRIQIPPFGPKTILSSLYNEIQAIQYGEKEDRHGWMSEIK
jgi:branched-chain amino acid aminotransferase